MEEASVYTARSKKLVCKAYNLYDSNYEILEKANLEGQLLLFQLPF